ncbi:CopD family protein [Novosphingobium album (ex Hu et al. 2023)]|uniref:CopD family protein n=1 Tax=Novosphingobium album (ex Hu et al. 2023) TaxID=2930093 RepID=A0ABT0B7I9_9SPHN|nr:CopD family protein [Novosphingobium album (ex Hu et al. 2023)]MCJ2180992.1 CopD family protein [Novosphingobium album (ex Hu et al. 2023)]
MTGALNVWLISGGRMPGGDWLLLIGLKVMLFLAMLGFATHNRWRLVPALENARPGTRERLLCSLLLETACAVAILVAVAFAGLLDPHAG